MLVNDQPAQSVPAQHREGERMTGSLGVSNLDPKETCQSINHVNLSKCFCYNYYYWNYSLLGPYRKNNGGHQSHETNRMTPIA